jgi:MSHA pilin protein MshD
MCTERFTGSARHRFERGLSMIELVMFVAIVGMAVAGILTVYSSAIKGSADPMVRKQAIAVAESLLGEVLMQPLTWCDPQDAANDPNTPPSSGASCTGGVGASQDKNGGTLGPVPATESRFSSTDPFDNVADYNGYAMASGIYSQDNGATPIAGLSAYAATVTVTRDGGTFGLPAAAVLRVDVLVTGKGESITLTGYRFRHSPNATG